MKTYCAWGIGTYFGGLFVIIPYLFVRKKILSQEMKKDVIDTEYKEVNESKKE